MVKELATKAEFDACLTEAGDKLVVVDFTASWCPPCQMIKPKFHAMADDEAYKGIDFYQLDVDANGEGSQAAGIQCMPTFQFFKGGAKVDELQGANEGNLKEKLAALLK